jgi:hypothetical protein
VDIPLARTRFDVFAAFMLIGYAAIFTALVWMATAVLDLGDTALTIVMVVLVVLWLFWSGTYAWTWTRMRRVESPLGLHGFGVFGRSQFGTLEVPWDAVRSAKVERHWSGRRLRIRLVPPTDPRHEGIVNHVSDPMMKIVDKQGMRFSLRILDITPEQLRQAFVVQSGGRVQVTS